MKLVWLKGI